MIYFWGRSRTLPKKTPLIRKGKMILVLTLENSKKVVLRGEPVKYYLPMEEMFDVIESSHIIVGYGGRDRLKVEITRKYVHVFLHIINVFLALCEACQKKKKRKVVFQNQFCILNLTINFKIDLINKHLSPHKQFKFILNYQDHLIKFVQLRSLQMKRTNEMPGIRYFF